jgi:hypothetical protein
MKNISTFLSFITVVLFLSSCTSHSFMLTERDVANDGIAPIKNNDYKTVANKPAELDANAKWVAAAKPYVVANSERISGRTDIVEMSAATTHEGHETLRREVEKAMKKDKPAPAPSKVRVKVKKQKEAGSHIML